MSHGELTADAMLVTTQAEADALFEKLVEAARQSSERVGVAPSREQLEQIVREHLGYHAGYYPWEVRERVERLFRCEHPVFGSIANGPPTFEQALAAGIATGIFVRVEREGRSSSVDIVDMTEAELSKVFETRDASELRRWLLVVIERLRAMYRRQR